MALRTIREMGDSVLEKKAKIIKDVTPRIRALAEDMLETMYESGGVGLAAPQVGILKRLVVIDVTEMSGSWRQRNFWPGRSAMNWIIWTAISMWKK